MTFEIAAPTNAWRGEGCSRSLPHEEYLAKRLIMDGFRQRSVVVPNPTINSMNLTVLFLEIYD